MGALSPDQIVQLGFASVGIDVTISDRCSIYGAGSISLGDHVRIDDFVILTAREPVVIGSYVHLSAFAFLSGPFGIVLEDFVNVSPRATLLSGNDDFSGQWLPGVLIPEDLRNVQGARIHLGRHSMVGAHSVVLPGVSFGEGAVAGALSLVKESLAPWGIYGGVPARLIRPRDRGVEELAARLTSGNQPTPGSRRGGAG
jgi:acetyltransferase-like isoleucine patch superfamily enzyme